MGKWFPGSRGRPPANSGYVPNPHVNRLKARARRRAKRKEWVAKGLCRDCGLKPVKNLTYCEEHRQYNRKRVLSIYYRRKEAGLCVLCGKPPVQGKSRCERCAARSSAYLKKYYKNGCKPLSLSKAQRRIPHSSRETPLTSP